MTNIEHAGCATLSATFFWLPATIAEHLTLWSQVLGHWAHVTLYYGAWFAAHSLLGMFGCQILRQYIIEVERSTPGNQQLRRHKIGNKQNQHNFVRSGSHQRFWEGFYATVPHRSPFADPRFAQTMAPIAGNEMWLVEQRNRINYKVFDTIDFRNSFVTSFSSRSFPSSLPGELNTQYSVCEGLLLISLSFASRFQLSTDALDSMGPKSLVSRQGEAEYLLAWRTRTS